jgi:hypothetical protein
MLMLMLMVMVMVIVIPVRLLTPTRPGIIIMIILITCVDLRHQPGEYGERDLCLGNKEYRHIKPRAQREVS